MELIKQLKKAETEARDIIAAAISESAQRSKQAKAEQAEQLDLAEQQRNAAIEKALATAETEADAEVAALKAAARTEQDKLEQKVRSKMNSAVTKVAGHI